MTAKYEEKIINEIQETLRNQNYQFTPVRKVDIPKPQGGKRQLGIANIKDRIVQTAMKIVIEPIFEADFHECSYGYRPKRNAKQASLRIRNDLYDKAATVVEIDFESYFDNIPHVNLLQLISKRISDGAILKLIKQTLKIGMSGITRQEKNVGVLQGSPISPLYSNIYLNLIDQIWHKMKYPWKLHRFADDVILICQRDGYKALTKFREIAKRLSLKLNENKTKVTKLKEGFDFIGFNFIKRKSPNSGKNAIYIFPTKTSEQKIRNSIKYKTSWRAPIKVEEFVKQMNLMIRGWTNYYCHTNASQAFRKLQRFSNTRFRRYLHRRSKGRGYGWQHYPNKVLYQKGMIYIGSGKLEYETKTPVNG